MEVLGGLFGEVRESSVGCLLKVDGPEELRRPTSLETDTSLRCPPVSPITIEIVSGR